MSPFYTSTVGINSTIKLGGSIYRVVKIPMEDNCCPGPQGSEHPTCPGSLLGAQNHLSLPGYLLLTLFFANFVERVMEFLYSGCSSPSTGTRRQWPSAIMAPEGHPHLSTDKSPREKAYDVPDVL